VKGLTVIRYLPTHYGGPVMVLRQTVAGLGRVIVIFLTLSEKSLNFLINKLFKWINIMIGNVKNAICDSCYSLSGKYLPWYLADFFNHRFDLPKLQYLPRLGHFGFYNWLS